MSDQMLTAIVTAIIAGVFSLAGNVFTEIIKNRKKKRKVKSVEGGRRVPSTSNTTPIPHETAEDPRRRTWLKIKINWLIVVFFLVLGGLVGYYVIFRPPISVPPFSTPTFSTSTPQVFPTATHLSSIVSYVNENIPGQSIYVHSSPMLNTASNIMGFVSPGDQVLVVGWTNAPWVWYQIDVPSKNLRKVWLSGGVQVGSKMYDALETNSSTIAASLPYINFPTPTP
jgi:hypothetical protein